MSARFVTAKVLGSLATLAFVVAFNFFLFRVVEGDPVANLFRGRNLSQSQRAELTKQFGLDGSTGEQFVRYLEQTAQLNLGRSYTDQPAGRVGDLAQGVADDRARRHLDAALDGVRRAARHRRGLAKTDEDRLLGDDASRWRRTRCPTSGSGMLLLTAFAVALGWFPVGGIVDPNSDATGLAKLADQAKHMFLPALTLTLAYLGEYALVMRSSLLDTMREDYLVLARAKGLRDIARAQPPRGAQRAAAGGDADRHQLRLRALRARSRWRRSSPGRASGLATYDALQGPDLPMLQGLFLVFSAAVIVANLLADLLYAYLDPRVRTA